MRAYWFVLAAILITSCQKTSEYTSTEALSKGRGILNGTPIPRTEFPSVGIVKAPTSLCTGTLISSDVVLTADHCVDDERGNLVSLKFTLDAQYSSSSPNLITVSSVRRYTYRDFALLKLASPISSVEPSELVLNPFTQSNLNRLVDVVGYGDSTTTSSGGKLTDSGAGTKRKGQSLFFRLDDAQYTIVSKPSTSRQVICPGDSGGPLFSSLNGRRQLFGVANSVLWRGNCSTVSETYHTQVAQGDAKTWLLNNLAAFAKRKSIFRGSNSRGNYLYTDQKGEGGSGYTYPPGTTGFFKLLDVPATFSNANCSIPLLRCRTSSGMNYLSANSCGSTTFEKVLGYACLGYRNSSSSAGSFDLYRVDNRVTGASLSLSLTDAQNWVRQNSNWRIIGFHGVHVLSPTL